MENSTIYSLEDPITNEVRYIGYTKKSLKQRLTQHLNNVREAEKGKRKWNYRLSWIKSLKAKPIIKEIEQVNACDVKHFEIFWISQFKTWGFNLVNLTNGGDGGDTYSMQSKKKKTEISLKISKALKGKKKPFSKEHKQALKDNHWSKKEGYVHPCLGKQSPKLNKSKYPEVVQFDLNNNILNTFSCLQEAAITVFNNVKKYRGILNCCNKKQKSAYGYYWEFKI